MRIINEIPVPQGYHSFQSKTYAGMAERWIASYFAMTIKPMNTSRCGWVNLANPLYIDYHDHEWGKPLHDDHALFELLCLE